MQVGENVKAGTSVVVAKLAVIARVEGSAAFVRIVKAGEFAMVKKLVIVERLVKVETTEESVVVGRIVKAGKSVRL